jgi:Uma2 family endonuclease
VIEGDLYVSCQPSFYHQFTCGRLTAVLDEWNLRTGIGVVAGAPGLIFAEDDAVAPDVVWLTWERFRESIREDGKLHLAPELVIEVLSPGSTNTRRDRDAKLQLYSRRGVTVYWIVSCQDRAVEIYSRRDEALVLSSVLQEGDVLESPLLEGFSCHVSHLFFRDPGPAR